MINEDYAKTASKMISRLILDEGKKYKPYIDSVGKITIGIGHNLSDNEFKGIDIKSMDLSKIEWSEDMIQSAFRNDLIDAMHDVKKNIAIANVLSYSRFGVLVNMRFNLGINGLLKFKKFLNAMKLYDWELASKEMLDSKWAEQVGARATRLAKIIRDGE